MTEPDLSFPQLAIGTHQVPWDLKILLHKGGAGMNRKVAIDIFSDPQRYKYDENRYEVVLSLHEVISSYLSLGRSKALVISSLEAIWRFFSWADENKKNISLGSLIEIFRDWSEFQIFRARIKKEISEIYAYRQTTRIAVLITRALKMPRDNSGKHLLQLTRVRKPQNKKNVLSSSADKQNLEHTFEFGNCLKAICDRLDIETVRGRVR